MWLTLEKGVLRGLRLRHGIELAEPDPGQPGRRALILHAVHTVLPEADEDDLPALARSELDAGLTGPVRAALADTDPADHDQLVELRDRLLEAASPQPGRTGVIMLADRIHLGRLVRGETHPVIAAGCVYWYGAYRPVDDPHQRQVAALRTLYHDWVNHPTERTGTEKSIKAVAAEVVGDQPEDLLDQPV
jgi:hypothetical protein